ncbi:hypothetical protein NPIL_477761 [Nephila pilipes]|uniref:Uncharacterized protein n=1 Tax=Nephila pilipes TaxID=299642 RepID=A0A8X6U7A2_NEPPI|nr:hypothetical protein NPIL_477761 [Nephila pilipes]
MKGDDALDGESTSSFPNDVNGDENKMLNQRRETNPKDIYKSQKHFKSKKSHTELNKGREIAFFSKLESAGASDLHLARKGYFSAFSRKKDHGEVGKVPKSNVLKSLKISYCTNHSHP